MSITAFREWSRQVADNGPLAQERTIVAMARALSPFTSSDLPSFARIALRNSGFTRIEVEAFLGDALRRVALRRAVGIPPAPIAPRPLFPATAAL